MVAHRCTRWTRPAVSCSLLQFETRQRGFDLSGTSLLDTLANIREVGALQTTLRKRKTPTLEITLSHKCQKPKRPSMTA